MVAMTPRAWVKIGRPNPGTRERAVLVNGDVVGYIRPWLAGRPAHARAAGWGVFADRDRDALLYSAATLSECVSWCAGFGGWPAACWVEMSGDHGYMPDSVGCCVGRWAAVESIIERFELGAGRRARLVRSDGYVELSARRDGAEYASVQRCECEACCAVTIADTDTWECHLCDSP